MSPSRQKSFLWVPRKWVQRWCALPTLRACMWNLVRKAYFCCILSVHVHKCKWHTCIVMLFFPLQHNSECLDGNVTCFDNYVPDVEGRLNATQVNELRDLLLQLFFFEYNHQDSILVDIRKIHQYITDSKFWKVYSSVFGTNYCILFNSWLFVKMAQHF